MNELGDMFALFMERRNLGAGLLASADAPARGWHLTVEGDGNGGERAVPRKTLLRRGGLAVHRNECQGYVVVDVSSGQAWMVLQNRRLALSVVRNHGNAWASILFDIESRYVGDMDAAERLRWFGIIVGLRGVYMRGDGEDDGGVEHDVEEPRLDRLMNEPRTMGLGYGVGFRGPAFILSYKADGERRAWVQETTFGWARFDAGARRELEYCGYCVFSGKGFGTTLLREYKSKRAAMTAEPEGAQPDDLPPKIVRLPRNFRRPE